MSFELLQNSPPWTWPEDAAPTLLAVLEDDGAPESDRVIAAELAGDIVVINDELADALLHIVSSGAEPDELRGTAAIALGPVLELASTEGFDEFDPFADVPITEATFERIQRTLRTLFRDADVPRDVRRRILEASVRAPQDWQTDAVRGAYHSDDELWRLTAVFSMHGFADSMPRSWKRWRAGTRPSTTRPSARRAPGRSCGLAAYRRLDHELDHRAVSFAGRDRGRALDSTG